MASQRRLARDPGQPRPAMLGLHHQPSHLTVHQAAVRSGAECGRPARRSDLMWSTAAQAAGCTALYNCTPRHRPHLATTSISFTLPPKTLTIHFRSFHRRVKPNRFCQNRYLVSWSLGLLVEETKWPLASHLVFIECCSVVAHCVEVLQRWARPVSRLSHNGEETAIADLCPAPLWAATPSARSGATRHSSYADLARQILREEEHRGCQS